MVEMSLQNCFPQESSPLLRAPRSIVGYPHELGATTGFELGTFPPLLSFDGKEEGDEGRWDEAVFLRYNRYS